MRTSIKKLLEKYHANQPELHQMVLEVYDDIKEFYNEQEDLQKRKVIEQLIEPDRIITFRVCWEDDNHCFQINRGWRVQHQNILGPYKGGIRFAPELNLSVLKCLAFEQSFKNALTDLPIGGAKGGANFDPKNKSEHEIRRFCWAYIEELRKYIGNDIDIPAGDIGVGTREIGYMYGHYIHLESRFTGVLTGKSPDFGGSCGRQQATGYGCVYFLEDMLKTHDQELKHKSIAISGAGNVALYAAEKALQEGAKVISLSDSDGCAHFKNGLNEEQLESIKALKFEQHGTLKQWAAKGKGVDFHQGKKPWHIPCDIAMPCATENEIDAKDLKQLIDNGLLALCEGANMPLTREAQSLRQQTALLYAPGKAANAGGVAVSVLEQSQNAQHVSWPLQKVDKVLRQTMKQIHERCLENIRRSNGIYNYQKGANLWAFKKLANTLVTYGLK